MKCADCGENEADDCFTVCSLCWDKRRPLPGFREHELKCWPGPFQAVVEGRKRFEYRKNDRGFEVGDILVLREWDPSSKDYTGRSVRARVTYALLGGFGIPDGFAVLSIELGMPPAQETSAREKQVELELELALRRIRDLALKVGVLQAEREEILKGNRE